MWEIDNDTILDECVINCLHEMYKWAQPSLDFKDYYKKLQNNEVVDDKESPMYEHHYLSNDNFLKIRDHYLNAYNLRPYWKTYCEVIKDYLLKGGHRDIFIEGKDGKPGYRSSEKTLPITSFLNKEDSDKIAKLLDDCANFYRFDRKCEGISATLSLGPSPTCNKEAVIKYWKSQGKDITIEDFNVEDKIYGTDDEENILVKEKED